MRGETWASTRENGSRPSRAIENITRVADAAIASAAEKIDDRDDAEHDPPEHVAELGGDHPGDPGAGELRRREVGGGDEGGEDEAATRRRPRGSMHRMIAFGAVRRGSPVSSESSAAESKPYIT